MIVRTLIILVAILSANIGLAEPVIQFPNTENFLPTDWQNPPINGQVAPLSKEDQSNAQKAVERTLKKYPKTSLSNKLNSISVVKALRFYDVPYGGTYIAKTRQVIIGYESEKHAGHGLLFEQRLHHEISSLFLSASRHQFDIETWQALNPKEFQYKTKEVIETGTVSVKVIDDQLDPTDLLKIDPKLTKLGFLNPYCLISLEQDFNELSAHVFANPNIWQHYLSSEPLKQKIDLLIEFYAKQDPRFTIDYFRTVNRLPIIKLDARPLTDSERKRAGWRFDHGLYVHAVKEGSSAQINGIQAGDILLIGNWKSFLQNRQIGDTVAVEIDRNGVFRYTAKLLLE